jgi:predicted RNA-binding Zn-ribbon protein involved in translation (DUF1610 family)
MSCPSHPPWLDHSNCTWRSLQVMTNNNYTQFYCPCGMSVYVATPTLHCNKCSSITVKNVTEECGFAGP